MIVTHLYHSGVLVELENHLLLFDYYQGELELNINKPLYIFVSHRHYDHYNPAIFKINHPHITYILSTSIRHKHLANYVETNQTYQFNDVIVKTLLSTDEGCAFIVKAEDKTIYHAGDLNWWYWPEESVANNTYQKETYQDQINLIDEPLDIAFVIVDIRQEDSYCLGLQYFLKQVQSSYIFPIHYFGDYSISNKLKAEKLDNPYQSLIMDIKHKNQKFTI